MKEISDLEGITIEGAGIQVLAREAREAHTHAQLKRSPQRDRVYCEALIDLYQGLCATRQAEASILLRERIVNRMVWNGCTVKGCTVLAPHTHEPMTATFLAENDIAQERGMDVAVRCA